MLFPDIHHLDQVLEAIKGRDEFIVKRDEANGYAIVNYLVAMEGTFPPVRTTKTINTDIDDDVPFRTTYDRQAAILRECRGMTFYLDSGLPAARKFHKFFNVGEREETFHHNIDFSEPHFVLEKLDGSMITPYVTATAELQWHSKMGNTFLTPIVGAFVEKNPQYEQFARDMLAGELTPIFEFCSRKQRIVIDYPKDRLVLLAIRDTYTGEYVKYDIMKQMADLGDVECVSALPGSIENIQEFMAQAQDLTGQEGYVVAFESGARYKIKGAEYIRMHRAKDSLTHEKNILFLIVTDAYDDILPLLTDDDRKRVVDYANAVNNSMILRGMYLTEIVERSAHFDQKTFALDVVAAHDSPFKGLLFTVRKGIPALDAIKDLVKKSCGSQSAVDSVRELISANWLYGGESE